MLRRTRLGSVCLLLGFMSAVLPELAPAQENPTNTLVIYGFVRDSMGRSVGGVSIGVKNETRNMASEASQTPYIPNRAGSYFCYIVDAGGGIAARSSDRIRLSIVDPENRLKRPPRLNPDVFTLSRGDAAACMKRLDIVMY